ncbi:Pyridine nucleotide-disulfide oxidoreductase, dimerization domain [Rhizoctonia solani]|uniref:Pyridine nucleotide-disulfide oxidoreductase, dimerization domain n=1 Tax=Rhizoctonia solani TaxID=456999 RepID=A0A8H7M1Y2_9AGAM|nr:Pyridine nucleotide-disulfide oxidoreductase, dimerization domain [Rhizoctonia solani]
MSHDYDVIVIGAGAVGENAADYATRGGLKVALVENELVGGECSYWACMPSKALLRPGAALHAALSVEGSKQAIPSEARLDVPAVLARRDAATSHWDDSGQAKWVKSANIDLVRGTAKITDIRKVTVGDTIYNARYAIVAATGSSAFIPDVPGLRDAKPWTSLACEMATAYAGFGSKITMVVRGQTLLGGQEDFAGQFVAEALEKLGASILLNTRPHPNTADLGVKQFQLPTLPGGWLDVDNSLLVRTTDWLYAVGDVNGRALLTHQGKYQARAAGSVIAARALGKTLHTDAWGVHVATADIRAVPQVTFTNPEVASVGLMSHIAPQKGISTRVVDYNLAWLAGSSVYSDDYKGQARLVVDTDKEVVVGATFVGPDTGELLHAATIAIVGEISIGRLWHAVPSYPTVSEIWLRLLDKYLSEK